MIYPINKLKNKKHIILTIDAERLLTIFTIKTLQKVSIKETYLKIIKTTYNKFTANIIPNLRCNVYMLSHFSA